MISVPRIPNPSAPAAANTKFEVRLQLKFGPLHVPYVVPQVVARTGNRGTRP